MGELLVCPKAMNRSIQERLRSRGWRTCRFVDHHTGLSWTTDFWKWRIGLEVQFGKYAFLQQDAAKLRILIGQGLIEFGVIVAPSRRMSHQMNSGVPCYERFVRELDLDSSLSSCPLLVIGIEESLV